jgi:hypothetical protein
MTNKIGSVVLLLTCIFISLGFGLLFQNKITLEGAEGRRGKNFKFSIPKSVSTTTSALTAVALSTPSPVVSTPTPEVFTTDYIMNKFKSSINTQITADKNTQSNNEYSNAVTKLTTNMKKIKPQPNDETSIKYYNTIIIECINYIIGLKLHITLNTDYDEGRINRLKYMKNFIILPNEPIDQAPEIIKKLDSIFMQTDKINKEKIKEIKTLVKTFAQK